VSTRLFTPALFVTVGLASATAYGDDTLHEGHAATVGVRTDGTLVTQLKADLAIFPYPGGPDVWGGPINATRLDLTLATQVDGVHFEQGRAQFIRWPHLHVLGLERDTRAGVAFGAEVFGLYVPVRLWGNIGARSWAIATTGADVGYRRQLAHSGARHDGHVGYSTTVVQVEAQHTVGERVQLRSFAEVMYTFAAGQIDGDHVSAMEHFLELGGGVGLYYDLTARPPIRRVPRTDPATGEVTYTTVANEGKRWRVIVLDISGMVRPFDTISTAHGAVIFKTGLSHEY
jgi:hypothetical protein